MAKKVLIPTKLDKTALETLEAHGGYTVFQQEGADLMDLAQDHSDAHAFIVRSEKVTPEVIDAYPNLKAIVRAGAGFNTIDIKYARSKNIDVMNTPGANSNAVAEEVLALMMTHARHLIPADASCRSGKWEKSSFMGSEITGKTLAILGLGHIGQLLVKRASGFDMKVIAYDPILSSDRAAEMGVELVSDHRELFRRGDYISLHIPENDHTRGMINAELFDIMKDDGVLINCARAGIINEDDLRAAKKAGKNIAYLNDVYPKDEAGDKPVADVADIMVPHLGASTREANRNAAEYAANQLIALDEEGIGSAIVNRDIPAGLDKSYYDLARVITKFCRAGFGPQAQMKMVQTFCYGELKPFAEWIIVPVVTALDKDFPSSLDHTAAVDRLKTSGIEYNCGDGDTSKGYGTSITVDLVAHGSDSTKLNKASIRGTVADGNIMISRINEFDQLYVVPEGHMVCFVYDDRPGVLAEITSALAEASINIDDVRNPHSEDGKRSIALIKVNQAVSEETISTIADKISASVAFHVEC